MSNNFNVPVAGACDGRLLPLLLAPLRRPVHIEVHTWGEVSLPKDMFLDAFLLKMPPVVGFWVAWGVSVWEATGQKWKSCGSTLTFNVKTAPRTSRWSTKKNSTCIIVQRATSMIPII